MAGPAAPGRPGRRVKEPTGASRGQPHSTYRHEAVLYRGEAGFLAGTVPFVREGVALGQPVMVAAVSERLELLRAALGTDAAHVRLVNMAKLGNPARMIPAWRKFVDEHGAGGRPVRAVGEPVFPARHPAEVAECQLHEALLNLAVDADSPQWLRCPYDMDALAPDVIEEAARSHPALMDGGAYRGSTIYGGADHASNLFHEELPEPAGDAPELHFDNSSIEVVRQTVLRRAAAADLDATRSADLSLAVTEAATNSVRHGGGRGQLRVWQEGGALVCEIRDEGHIADPLVGRRMPSLTAEGGHGLWLVNQLSDLAQVRSTPRGCTVRVLAWL